MTVITSNRKNPGILPAMRLIRFPRLVNVGMERPVGAAAAAAAERRTGATPVDSFVVFLSDRWFVHLDMLSTLRRYRRKTEAEAVPLVPATFPTADDSHTIL
ncbi:hypothetical protein ALC62_08456 [Cyphomyrmex costatus]|uniref:Uncharacterized protein n=1 Tax=Cyphomyrmex costatus TaxID=456900 RepID=A0A195CJ79_9HYME|nr:hypothetical protein ALC62_08456 [Cyphomyrmex costatus]